MSVYLVYITERVHQATHNLWCISCTLSVNPRKIQYLPRVKIHGSGTGGLSRPFRTLFFPPFPLPLFPPLALSRLILFFPPRLPSLLPFISPTFRATAFSPVQYSTADFSCLPTRRARLSQIHEKAPTSPRNRLPIDSLIHRPPTLRVPSQLVHRIVRAPRTPIAPSDDSFSHYLGGYLVSRIIVSVSRIP